MRIFGHSAIDSEFTVSPAANTTEVSIDQDRCSYVTERTSQAFSANHGCELCSFNPVPSAACLLDPVFAQVLLIPEQAPLLHAAKLMVIVCVCA